MKFEETLEILELNVEIMRYQLLLFGKSQEQKGTIQEMRIIHQKLKKEYESKN